MLTREKVLVELAVNGAMRIGESAIFRQCTSPGGFMCGEDIFEWKVRSWDGSRTTYCEEDVLEAVDMFIRCQVNVLDFPDADELREVNKQAKEAEYKQWCEEHEHELRIIASGIHKANAIGRRTIEFDVPCKDTEGNYRRYFTGRHYDVTMQKYSEERVEKRGYMLCKLDWSATLSRRRRKEELR